MTKTLKRVGCPQLSRLIVQPPPCFLDRDFMEFKYTCPFTLEEDYLTSSFSFVEYLEEIGNDLNIISEQQKEPKTTEIPFTVTNQYLQKLLERQIIQHVGYKEKKAGKILVG